jgi:hypothetical protein
MVKVLRIEKQIIKKLYESNGLLGNVEHIYHNGFYLKSKNGDLLYFQSGKWLQSPFSVVLDVDVHRWISDVSLTQGDVFCIDNEQIYSSTNRNVKLRVHEPRVVDLTNTVVIDSYEQDEILLMAQEIVNRLLSCGRNEGVLATLEIFKRN